MKILDVYIQHAKLSLNRPFSYLYEGDRPIGVGYRVLVRFASQHLLGYVAAVRESEQTADEIEQTNGYRVEFIERIIDERPLLNEELMKLSDEVAEHYLAPKISVLQAMLPSSLKPTMSALHGPKIAYEDWVSASDPSEEGLTAKQIEMLRLIVENGTIRKREAGSPAVLKNLLKLGRVKIEKKEKERLHLEEYEKEQPHPLTILQQKAVEDILTSEKEVVLLQGVTGSGKTEVYLKLSEAYLSQGKTVLMLVPEISLTPIMVEYFSRRFHGNVAILHSELTPAEKYDEYRRIASGKANVVVGARSAVFAPLTNIGLIILDEEHVESYKQDGLPFYHAKDVAILRAKHFGAKVVLGSATPSLETKARAVRRVYGYASLPKRVNEKALPLTSIIDLTKRSNMVPNDPIFSKPLYEGIQDRLAKKEQSILLINRRGYSSYVACKHCGHIFTCPECHGNLTYHKNNNMLKCHHCDYVAEYPDRCPECGSDSIMRVGFGTERIVKVLQEHFPEARICRLDSDVGQVRNNIAKTINAFRAQEYDILVGTQMIAKGHDFPNVTLVGVVLADIGLSLPTYRATERTFELITQAVGRSGRGDKPGVAIIQTYNPTHYAITLGAKQDYEAFFSKEMQVRRISQYPPYVYLISILFSSKSEERCIQAAHDVKENLRLQGFEGVSCLGPVAPYLAFIGERHRRYLLIKYKSDAELRPYLESMLSTLSGRGGVDITFDVDPIDF